MRAILFDLDDTIYARIEPFATAFEQTFSFPCSRQLYSRFVHFGYDLFEASMQGRVPMQTMHIDRISKTAATIGIIPTTEEAISFQKAYEDALDHLTLSQTMASVLTLCRERADFLGVVTNGESAHQRIKYDSLQLSRWISPDHFLPTGDIGVNKPDPRALLAAMERWQLSAADIWYIGDSLQHDVACAQKLDVQTIWLNRYPERELSGEDALIRPAIRVDSEEELLLALQNILENRI